jgi:hypothetical protein
VRHSAMRRWRATSGVWAAMGDSWWKKGHRWKALGVVGVCGTVTWRMYQMHGDSVRYRQPWISTVERPQLFIRVRDHKLC